MYITQTIHFNTILHKQRYYASAAKITLAGFEPGSLVHEADAMTTAPQRQVLHYR
jgi:hypothetical protein